MDLAVTLPLSVLFTVQALLALLLLLPRPVSKQAAALLSFTRTNQGAATVTYTVAGAVSVMTLSSLIQLADVMKAMRTRPLGDRMLSVTVEELRALLTTVLGAANLVLIFTNRSLAHEQQQHDKAQLNLEVLRKQAKGLSAEYMRATKADGAGAGPDLAATVSSLKSELRSAQEELRREQQDREVLRGQAKGLEREYDRVLAECDDLRKQLARTGGGGGGAAGGSKKAD